VARKRAIIFFASCFGIRSCRRPSFGISSRIYQTDLGCAGHFTSLSIYVLHLRFCITLLRCVVTVLLREPNVFGFFGFPKRFFRFPEKLPTSLVPTPFGEVCLRYTKILRSPESLLHHLRIFFLQLPTPTLLSPTFSVLWSSVLRSLVLQYSRVAFSKDLPSSAIRPTPSP